MTLQFRVVLSIYYDLELPEQSRLQSAFLMAWIVRPQGAIEPAPAVLPAMPPGLAPTSALIDQSSAASKSWPTNGLKISIQNMIAV